MPRHPDSDQQPCRCPRKEARRRARFFNKYAAGISVCPTAADYEHRRSAISRHEAMVAMGLARDFVLCALSAGKNRAFFYRDRAIEALMSARGHMHMARIHGWSLPSLTAHDRSTMMGVR